jgi:hypothetical protein
MMLQNYRNCALFGLQKKRAEVYTIFQKRKINVLFSVFGLGGIFNVLCFFGWNINKKNPSFKTLKYAKT